MVHGSCGRRRSALCLILLLNATTPGAARAGGEPVRNGRIAYIRQAAGGTDVGSIRGDGNGYRNLTDSAANELYVDVSPDGKRVAFSRFTSHGGEIYTIPVGGGRAKRLTSDDVHDELPVWSPDSSKIAFVRYPDEDDPEIFVMDADGSGLVQITDNSEIEADPRWSPDGARLAYQSGNVDENEQDIFVTTLGQPGRFAISPSGVNDAFPVWVPNGLQVLFSSYVDEQWDLYVANLDGSGLTRMTTDPLDDWDPRFSPDGARISFVRGRLEGSDPLDEVHVMNADGSGDKGGITPPSLDAFSPSWAPNGERIVFIGKTGRTDNWEVYTVRPEGTSLIRVTRTKAMEFDPSWARAGG